MLCLVEIRVTAADHMVDNNQEDNIIACKRTRGKASSHSHATLQVKEVNTIPASNRPKIVSTDDMKSNRTLRFESAAALNYL